MNKQEKLDKVYMFNKRRFKTHITIYEITKDELFPKNPKFGINWAAFGTVDSSTAKRFMKNLSEAIKFVEELNEKGDKQ